MGSMKSYRTIRLSSRPSREIMPRSTCSSCRTRRVEVADSFSQVVVEDQATDRREVLCCGAGQRLSRSLVASSAFLSRSIHAQSSARGQIQIVRGRSLAPPALSISDDPHRGRSDREEQDRRDDDPIRSQLGDQHGFEHSFGDGGEIGRRRSRPGSLRSRIGPRPGRCGDESRRDDGWGRVAERLGGQSVPGGARPRRVSRGATGCGLWIAGSIPCRRARPGAGPPPSGSCPADRRARPVPERLGKPAQLVVDHEPQLVDVFLPRRRRCVPSRPSLPPEPAGGRRFS